MVKIRQRRIGAVQRSRSLRGDERLRLTFWVKHNEKKRSLSDLSDHAFGGLAVLGKLFFKVEKNLSHIILNINEISCGKLRDIKAEFA